MSNEGHPWLELGQLVSLIVRRQTSTRAELARTTGLARSTISQRVDELLDLGVLIEAGEGRSSGGRRPTLLALNPAAGVVLAADLGATHARIAMATLSGQPVAEGGAEMDIADGPEIVLGWLVDRFHEMLAANDRTAQEVRAVGMGVPGPVEFATGTVVQPPIMPGWDGVVVPSVLSSHFDAPIFVDNDVNIMGLGEYWSRGLLDEQVLFVKVATGIGCGIITNGEVHRGADGAAGDIGHVRVAVDEDVLCSCGNLNCLEAVASGSALARQLAAEGLDAEHAIDVVRLSQAGTRGRCAWCGSRVSASARCWPRSSISTTRAASSWAAPSPGFRTTSSPGSVRSSTNGLFRSRHGTFGSRRRLSATARLFSAPRSSAPTGRSRRPASQSG